MLVFPEIVPIVPKPTLLNTLILSVFPDPQILFPRTEMTPPPPMKGVVTVFEFVVDVPPQPPGTIQV